MTDTTPIKRQIKNIIITVLNLSIAPEEIGDDDLLFSGESGVDSIATLEIVSAIEETFGVAITDDEIDVELFESVSSLSTYVKKQLDLRP